MLLTLVAACRTPGPQVYGEGKRGASTVAATTASVAPVITGSRYDFCRLSQAAVPNFGVPEIWNAARVASEVQALRNSKGIKGSPWEAYPAIYLRMTAARDRERCAGGLHAENQVSQLIGDRLADLMSRFYVLETRQCGSAVPPRHGSSGFCGLMQRIKAEKLDALTAAMASTAVYISSHIALALRAVVMDDYFWNDLAAHGSGSPELAEAAHADPARARRVRLALVAQYRPEYDKFNGFLADQIATAVGALSEEGLLSNQALIVTSGLAKYVSFRSCFFRRIRDGAFDAAVQDSKELGGLNHPMMVSGPSGVVHADPSRFDFAMPSTRRLQQLEDFALAAVAGPSQRLIYQHLLGGRTWDDLERSNIIGNKDGGCTKASERRRISR